MATATFEDTFVHAVGISPLTFGVGPTCHEIRFTQIPVIDLAVRLHYSDRVMIQALTLRMQFVQP